MQVVIARERKFAKKKKRDSDCNIPADDTPSPLNCQEETIRAPRSNLCTRCLPICVKSVQRDIFSQDTKFLSKVSVVITS